MNFSGHVVSGIGRGAQFLALDWVLKQLQESLGLIPYPGTLNLRVPPKVRQRLLARRNQFLRIADPAAPNCPGYLRQVALLANNRTFDPAYLILPEKTIHYDVLEIIAAVRLRDALTLKDGDTLTVNSRLD